MLAITSGTDSPEASATPIAIGTTAASVPIELPMASEMKPASTNRPGSKSGGGNQPRPNATTASTAPIAWPIAANAPASRKIRHISMTLASPMPASSRDCTSMPRRRAIHAPSATAGRIATGARSV